MNWDSWAAAEITPNCVMWEKKLVEDRDLLRYAVIDCAYTCVVQLRPSTEELLSLPLEIFYPLQCSGETCSAYWPRSGLRVEWVWFGPKTVEAVSQVGWVQSRECALHQVWFRQESLTMTGWVCEKPLHISLLRWLCVGYKQAAWWADLQSSQRSLWGEATSRFEDAYSVQGLRCKFVSYKYFIVKCDLYLLARHLMALIQ